MRTLVVIGTAIGAALVVAGSAGAQCAFQHPTRTRAMVLPLVQAHVPCEIDAQCAPDGQTRPANTTTDIGVFACDPPLTFNELAGSPPDGWLWGPSSMGTVYFEAIPNRIEHPLNPPNDTRDVSIRLTLVGIRDADGLATGVGWLRPLRRTTFKDRANGDMTVVDLSLPGFPVHVTNGRASVRTTANVVLNTIGFPGVPGCTALELVGLELRDPNDTLFASPGIFMPPVS